MATYTAQHLFVWDAPQMPVISDLHLQGAVPPLPSQAWDLDLPDTAANAVVYPSVVVNTHTGGLGYTYFHDFYYRFHIIPVTFTLGNVLTQVSENVELFNAFLVDKDFTALSQVGVGDVTLTGLTPTYTFQELESQIMTLEAPAIGPPSIDTVFTLTIGGVDYDLTVTGNRVILFPFKPNWKQGIQENLTWLTTVNKHIDQSQQRSSLRSKPRRKLAYDITTTHQDTRLMETLITGWRANLFAVPVWHDASTLDATFATGNSTMLVNTTTKGFVAGGLLVMYNSPQDFEPVQIDSVNEGAGTITLSQPASKDWDAGTAIVPATFGYLEQAQPVRRETSTVSTAALSFNIDVVGAELNLPDVAATTTYEGIEVLEDKPNWQGGIQHNYGSNINVFDSDSGAIAVDQLGFGATIVRRFEWLISGRPATLLFREFIQRRKGRLVPLYVPSDLTDIQVVSNISAASTSLKVENNSYSQFLDFAENLRKVLKINTAQGIFYRRIQSMSGPDGQGYIDFNIEAALGFDLTPEEVYKISYMDLCTLATDSVTVNWHTPEVITVGVNFEVVDQ